MISRTLLLSAISLPVLWDPDKCHLTDFTGKLLLCGGYHTEFDRALGFWLADCINEQCEEKVDIDSAHRRTETIDVDNDGYCLCHHVKVV